MCDYRVSTYELVFPLPSEPSRALAFNGLYGAFDIVSSQEAALLTEAQRKPALLGELCEQTRQRLASRGHITRQSAEGELDNLRILCRLHWLLWQQRATKLVILPTYNCNFRCEYCFERHRLTRGSDWLSRVMTRPMVDAVFRQMEAYKQSGRKLDDCTLYGGEPLLRANRDIVEYICQRSRALDMPLSFVSNGYELDAFVDLLARYDAKSVQITVDGLAPVHDARRYLAGGQGTYARIMDNIAIALGRGIHISLRVNVNRANLHSAMELPQELRRRGFLESAHFNYYFKATAACHEADPANAVTDLEVLRSLRQTGMKLEECFRHTSVMSSVARCARDVIKNGNYPPIVASYCGAEASMICVDPDGVLYSCWELVGNEQCAVGITDVEKGRFLFDLRLMKWQTRTLYNMPDCRCCPYLMYCGGGCAAESENVYGDKTRGNCGVLREAFDYIVPIVCERYMNDTHSPSLGLSLYDLFADLTPEERQLLLTTTSQREAYTLAKEKLKDGLILFD